MLWNLFLCTMRIAHKMSNTEWHCVVEGTHDPGLHNSWWHHCSMEMQMRRKCLQLPGAAKSNPLQLFAVFSATAWNFCVKFCTFTWLSYLHFNAKWHLTLFKYDEVIDILAWPLSDFRALKNVCAETQQNNVTETTQCFLFKQAVREASTICPPPASWPLTFWP